MGGRSVKGKKRVRKSKISEWSFCEKSHIELQWLCQSNDIQCQIIWPVPTLSFISPALTCLLTVTHKVMGDNWFKHMVSHYN